MRGADAGLKDGRAVTIAIHRNGLDSVKMLVERISVEVMNERKRRVKEHLSATKDMRLAAIETDAKKISQYLIANKFFPPVTTSWNKNICCESLLQRPHLIKQCGPVQQPILAPHNNTNFFLKRRRS